MSSIESPCVRNCCLDDEDVCLGCFRTMKEIMAWNDVDDEEKREILKNAELRRKEKEIDRRG